MLACLLHDIGVASFIRADHGYWGAQLIEPYVDEEVSWAIKVHQALRFFPDEAAGYAYPDMYKSYFGEDYQPEPYIVEEYQRARSHKHYMTARLICVNDIYSFDPNAKVSLDDFTDIIGRNFRQPKEGLGLDSSVDGASSRARAAARAGQPAGGNGHDARKRSQGETGHRGTGTRESARCTAPTSSTP